MCFHQSRSWGSHCGTLLVLNSFRSSVRSRAGEGISPFHSKYMSGSVWVIPAGNSSNPARLCISTSLFTFSSCRHRQSLPWGASLSKCIPWAGILELFHGGDKSFHHSSKPVAACSAQPLGLIPFNPIPGCPGLFPWLVAPAGPLWPLVELSLSGVWLGWFCARLSVWNGAREVLPKTELEPGWTHTRLFL